MRCIYLVSLLAIIATHAMSCHSSDKQKTIAERKAEEQSLRNPIKKGRYKCWLLSPSGEKAADDLYILSDNLYQVNDVVGRYRYHAKNHEIEWIDGVFHKPVENWVGSYFSKETATVGKNTSEPAIRIRSQTNGGSQRANVIRCSCVEFE